MLDPEFIDNLIKLIYQKLSMHYSFINKVILISDSNVYPLHGIQLKNTLEKEGLKVSNYVVEAGEENKSLATAEKIWKFLFLSQADKQTLVLNLGGGMICDLGGFAASTYLRGIPLLNIPTSLLAMVDAALGGKNGVNTPFSKNSLGCFYQPQQVYIDPAFLNTLPDKELIDGLAEIYKYGFISHPDFIHNLPDQYSKILARDFATIKPLLQKSCEIKLHFVRGDEKEVSGLRSFLNFGHTFAHALEAATQYRLFSHGEAVSIGMCCALKLSELLGYLDSSLVQIGKQALVKAGLPTQLPSLNLQKIISLMKQDKKNTSSHITCVLLKNFGEPFLLKNIPEAFVLEALESVSLEPKGLIKA